MPVKFKLFVILSLFLNALLQIETLFAQQNGALDSQLDAALKTTGFNGNTQSSLVTRLGRNLQRPRVNLGKSLFFDPILSLRRDNSCAGCHSPKHGFGDSQSIAIGILNNGKVGPKRAGPRNQRRTPMLLNIAFYPRLMWNGRFFAATGDPFDNSQGFIFPLPEGETKFPANDQRFRHLLVAQAHIPPTELVEMAGLKVKDSVLDSKFKVFDDGKGFAVPAPDENGFRNDAIRNKIIELLNQNNSYRRLFDKAFPRQGLAKENNIKFEHVAQALAEFQFSLTRANAPIDRYARGDKSALSNSQKRGAVLFWGKAGCINCHSVSDKSSEMFSDFENHRVGVPQLVAQFGKKSGNVVFDGDDSNHDFGEAQISGDSEDRYKFRSSPLRNIALQPTFFHDGAYTKLEDALIHHLNVIETARSYDPKKAGVSKDLRKINPIIEPQLESLDPLIATTIKLSSQEFADLLDFLKVGLMDPNAKAEKLCKLIPKKLPSRIRLHEFEGCN